MAESILWFQSGTTMGHGTIIQGNTVRLLDGMDFEAQTAFNKIVSVEGQSELFIKENNLQVKKVPGDRGVVVKSNFIEVDNFNRRIAYMYYSDSTTVEQIVQDLTNLAQLGSRTVDKGDYDVIRTLHWRKKKKSYYLLFVIVAIILLIIYLLIQN